MTQDSAPTPPDFEGQTITEVGLGCWFSLRTDADWLFRLYGQYFLTRPGFGTVELEPPEGEAGTPPLVQSLLGATIRDVVVSAEGYLAIDFSDKTQVSVRFDRDERPWQIFGPGGVKFRWLPDEGRPEFWVPNTPEEDVELFHQIVPSFEGKTFELLKWNQPLMMWTEDNWSIDVYDRARLSIDGRDPIEFDGMTPSETPIPEVSELLDKPMLGLELLPSGQLTFRFEHAALTLLPHPDNDSWCLGGSEGERIFCDYGGQLVIFGPLRD